MGCMLRSDLMTKCCMYLQPDAAFEILSSIGELGCVQFIDLFPGYQLLQRRYGMEVCRYSEMERKLTNVRKEMTVFDINPPEQEWPSKAEPLANLEDFENQVQKWDEDMQELNENEENMLQGFLELSEFQYCLQYIGTEFSTTEFEGIDLFQTKKEALGELGIGIGGHLIVTTGVVRRTRSLAFQTMLTRICRGILYYKQAKDDKIFIDPSSRKEVRKVAFIAICQGEELATRIQKVCAGFKVNTFPCPSRAKDRRDLLLMLTVRVSDLEEVLKKTKYLRCRFLFEVAKSYRLWMGTVRKSKAIYHILNQFRYEKGLIGECWIPNNDLDKVSRVLSDVSAQLRCNVASFMSKIETNEMHPTYHRTNKFTRGFQNLINVYGDSTYRELNPGLYTLVTFPFLFAMMFPDLGHGFILVLFAVWMIKNEGYFLAQRPTNEIWNIIFGGRYVILLMGFFSMYVGFCYNDLFSRSFSVHDSYYTNYLTVRRLRKSEYINLDRSRHYRRPYFFGEDPFWKLATNKIIFENSFKMKIALIVGILHMMFGILLSFFNYTYFGRYYSIPLQFVPELLFLTLMCFWLVVMIYVKWFIYTPKTRNRERTSVCAPQILVLFIDMMLMSETKPANEGCTQAYMFPYQRFIQMNLIFTAVACVLVLLFGTPIYKVIANVQNRKTAVKNLENYRSLKNQNPNTERQLVADVDKYSVTFADLMVHQGVHTIEFVLSTVSHTASYLRLWALSLAHAQLSDMLWNIILSNTSLKVYSLMGAIRLIPSFALWAISTLFILVVMDGLSASLHCLRLHWVEFMSKFYEGAGCAFKPFSFKGLLERESGETDECKKFDLLWPNI